MFKMHTLRRNGGAYPDSCKSHTTRSRSEKEASNRGCTAKLTKQELEDLYYNVYEENTQLKSRLYTQDDQIKCLNAKVQRLNHLQRPLGLGEKDCCVRSSSIVSVQKEKISELKLTNQRLSEKIKQLNRQICSTKQFLKGNGSVNRCSKCRARITSLSYVNPYTSETNTNVKQSIGVSCNHLDRSEITTRSVGTSITPKSIPMVDSLYTKGYSDKRCENNKCLCEMEELKQRTTELENELFIIQEKHLHREALMERQVVAGRRESSQLRRINEELEQRVRELAGALRSLEIERCDLSAQLTLEKRRVAELEARARLSCTSSEITRVLRRHLCQKIKEEHESSVTTGCRCSSCQLSCNVNMEPAPMATLAETDKAPKAISVKHSSKNSDDSGYAEGVRRDEHTTNKMSVEETNAAPPGAPCACPAAPQHDPYLQSMELIEKMNNLQRQIDVLKTSAFSDQEHLLNEQQLNEPLVEEDAGIEQGEETAAESQEKPAAQSGSLHSDDELSTGNGSAEARGSLGASDESPSASSDHKREGAGSASSMAMQASPKQSLIAEIEIPGVMELHKAIAIPEEIVPHKPVTMFDQGRLSTSLFLEPQPAGARGASARKHDCSKSKSDQSDKKDRTGRTAARTRSRKLRRSANGDQIAAKSPARDDKPENRSSKSSDRSQSRSGAFTRTMVRGKGIRSFCAGNVQVLQTSQGMFTAARRPAPPSLHTYSIDGDTRAAPDTDTEISSLSDLPSEDSVVRRSLGEDTRAPSSSSEPATDCASLSEGELPAAAESILSVGETKIINVSTESKMSSPEQMRAALSEVSKEMLRCRRLLQQSRPPPKTA